ncbi:phosphate regulon sensor histidine kinase PhoR [Halomonas denitrificans]|uniref:phosphate regulon sensor histidine kinase PhoR n=1 Tax=Halomonas TaxID=2745 RepID=UPI001A8F6DD3|nr:MULTISPECIES: phosphate regulon sensor histidine kinase PhoR [Halomonas]MBN8412757.1 phosphate regulon sensor histidine kinase PhoR [Halomonas litopenaei]MED5295839.1 phosphate regulon sensor histidine kinase PhoR [Pseudomonadota bacterium]MBY5925052.1 phosphate regulon sensor histidine kinase PhoR [Halomonas sp. DP4Y7-2]MBY5928847.1 phosphate regulon sensor histidine kinase PhoR [Halomonas sp. DP8Y7-3]MBY6031159.1 phosphate regulon sensor histidine kinase PhoR [Halomonas sp. DP8Y7-1]
MGRLWRREVWRLTLLVGIGALLGWPFSLTSVGVGAGLTLGLAYHLRNLHAMHDWLTHRPQQEPPTASGLWGELFDRLYRYQKGQRITQRRLRSTLQRIQESSEAMRDSVVMLDRHGDLEWWNSSAERMLGLKPALDRGQHITNLLRDPRFVGYFNERDYREPLSLPSPIDENMILQFQITLYGDDERLVMARDITRLHRLEQMRRDFVANVSHELRTPLTVLTGYLETYGDMADMLPERLGKGVAQMQNQTRRMQNLVNDLLLLSRLENDQGGDDHTRLDPTTLLQTVKRDAQALSGGRQQIEVSIDDPRGLKGSEKEIHSAISNLAFNAVRYAGDGARIQLRWRAYGDGACLEVEDDGDGIDPMHLPRLTERFYRVDKGRSTATGGTGLGLAIVKHVLLRHDARLDIDSHPGEGATFRCIFPSSRVQENRQTAASP